MSSVEPDPHVDQPRRFGYRPALDGLRAVAVLAVLLYHGAQLTAAPIDVAPGGFLGVDLFMVLSGFLITTLLLVEWDRDERIALGAFYLRRARRLLPALLVVLAAVAAAFLLADLAGLDDGQAADYPGDALASLLYVANWRFALSGASYFDQFGGPSPLRHLWSLAIEEQFYLVWPLLLVGMLRVLRLGRRALAGVIVVLIAGSAALMAVLFTEGTDPSRIYYGTDTRAQALLVGALLAVLVQRTPSERVAGPAVQGLGAVGLLGCLAMFVVATDDPGASGWLYRGGFLVMAVLGALAILGASATEPTPYVRALSLRPLVWLGTISYGLYLWHWPVYVVLDTEQTGLEGLPLLAVRIVVSVGLAVASFHLVERPIRFGALARPRGRSLALVAGGVAVALLAVSVVVVGPEEGSLEALSDEEITALQQAPVSTAQVGEVKVLLVGDSVAQTLGYYQGPTPGLAVKTAAIIGCGVARGQRLPQGRPPSPLRPECETWPETWAAALAEFQPDVTVLMVGAWEVFDRQVDGRRLAVGSDEYAAYLRQELDLARQVLTATGRPLVLLTAACSKVTRPGTDAAFPERDEPWRTQWVNEVLVDFADAHDDVVLVDLYAHLCPDGTYVGELGGVPLYKDGTHYTPEGAPLVWEWLTPQLQQAAAG